MFTRFAPPTRPVLTQRRTMPWWQALLSGVMAFFLMGHALAESYSFGVVPQQSATRLAKLWTPLMHHLSAQTGVKLTFTTAKDIPVFEDRLRTGDYDFAYMNPYHFTVFHENPGYLPLLTHKDQQLKGILVARKDSGIASLKDLQGMELAFPAPAAFAATIIPQATLHQQGIAFTSQYVSSHDSVYLSVAKGLYKAGGGVQRTFNAMPQELQDQLVVFWTSPGYTPHAIAVNPRVPVEVREKVSASLIALLDSAEGRSLLETIEVPKGFRAAVSEDWDDIRALNLKQLDDGQQTP